MKILNLYSGIGGNRHLWGSEHEITAVEINPEIAGIYRSKFPNDKVIVTDAHYYLLEHYKEFDFIWSSPPCPSHSKLCFSQNTKQYTDVTLYQQIILLKSWFKGKYVIENVIPYYDYLVEPSFIIGRHPFWSNFNVTPLEVKNIDVTRSTTKEMSEYLGIPIPRYKAGVTLRNSVEPKTGLHILNSALGIIAENDLEQNKLF
jgi:DNA (cytosine-5)-methyltransferase 1|tara:strand:- start:155 stop:760 length:606 start_codon:yes stop_codon:yes gene_type:complete